MAIFKNQGLGSLCIGICHYLNKEKLNALPKSENCKVRQYGNQAAGDVGNEASGASVAAFCWQGTGCANYLQAFVFLLC